MFFGVDRERKTKVRSESRRGSLYLSLKARTLEGHVTAWRVHQGPCMSTDDDEHHHRAHESTSVHSEIQCVHWLSRPQVHSIGSLHLVSLARGIVKVGIVTPQGLSEAQYRKRQEMSCRSFPEVNAPKLVGAVIFFVCLSSLARQAHLLGPIRRTRN